jgi:hypothetical protein
MIAALPPYLYRITMRVAMLALAAAAGGAVALLVIVLPSSVLRSVGAVPFSLEDSSLFWPVLVVAAFWSMAHTLDSIVELTNATRRR